MGDLIKAMKASLGKAAAAVDKANREIFDLLGHLFYVYIICTQTSFTTSITNALLVRIERGGELFQKFILDLERSLKALLVKSDNDDDDGSTPLRSRGPALNLTPTKLRNALGSKDKLLLQ